MGVEVPGVLFKGGSGGHDIEGGSGGGVAEKAESEKGEKGGEEWYMGSRQDMWG